MSISKIVNFTSDTSLLNKIKNQPVTQQVTQEAIQQTVPQIKSSGPGQTEAVSQEENHNEASSKSHKVRNWSIGLGSAAVLISLGVLGRRGKLGKGIQALLGGAERKAGATGENISGGLDDISHKPKTDTEINPDIPRPNYIKINDSLDRSIPQITEPLYIEVPELPKNLEEIKTLARKEFSASPESKDYIKSFDKDGEHYTVMTYKNGKFQVMTDNNNTVFFDKNEQVMIHQKNEIAVSYDNGKIANVVKLDKDQNRWIYDSEGNITAMAQTYFSNGQEITKVSVIENGRVRAIRQSDAKTKIKIKDDYFNENGEIIHETFYDAEGNAIKSGTD